MRGVVAILFAAAVAVAGCSAKPTKAEAPDAGVPTSTVTGRSYTRCRQIGGDVEVPNDLSRSVIQALIPLVRDRGHEAVEGTGSSDGSFSIQQVPDGITYLLRIDDVYLVTSRRSFDLYRDRRARCTPAPATAGAATPVTLELKDMTPFATDDGASDSLVVGSFALGHQSFALSDPEQVDETTVATTYDWATRGPASPLPDAAAGDDLYVLHHRSERFGDPATHGSGYVATRLVDALQKADVTLQSGVSARITGRFQPAALNKTVSFTLDRGLFTAGSDGLTAPSDPSVTITAQPRGHEAFDLLEPSAAVLAEFSAGDPASSARSMLTVTEHAYADPFPADWQRTATVQLLHIRTMRHPGPFGSQPMDQALASIVGLDRVAIDFTGAVPTVPWQKPRARLGGVDFVTGGVVKFDGDRPVPLTWDTVPGAGSYLITIRRLNPKGADSTTTSVALLQTAETSIQIPAQIFRGGTFFAFTWSATQAAADSGADPRFTADVPNQIVTLMSGRFGLGPACGDFALTSGEDCDHGGVEDTICNRDCTFAMCGDGMHNAPAHEACDAAGDTPSCDSDCTLPVCGDNHVNRFVEDCDDGNTVNDGNGCGVDCRRTAGS